MSKTTISEKKVGLENECDYLDGERKVFFDLTPMSDYNFNFISEEDQQNAAYGLCRAGVTGIGILVGSLAAPAVGPGGVVYGAVAGYALWGPFFCKRLAPAIKKKLFARNGRLENHEVDEALRALREARPTLSKSEALNVLATVRQEAARNPSYIKDVA